MAVIKGGMEKGMEREKGKINRSRHLFPVSMIDPDQLVFARLVGLQNFIPQAYLL